MISHPVFLFLRAHSTNEFIKHILTNLANGTNSKYMKIKDNMLIFTNKESIDLNTVMDDAQGVYTTFVSYLSKYVEIPVETKEEDYEEDETHVNIKNSKVYRCVLLLRYIIKNNLSIDGVTEPMEVLYCINQMLQSKKMSYDDITVKDNVIESIRI